MSLVIENATVQIADLLPPLSASLAGIRATNVTFFGPAVLLLHGAITFGGNTQILGDVEGILWDFPETRNTVTGAIDVQGATFTDCTFHMIGFTGRHDMLQGFIGTATVPPADPAAPTA